MTGPAISDRPVQTPSTTTTRNTLTSSLHRGRSAIAGTHGVHARPWGQAKRRRVHRSPYASCYFVGQSSEVGTMRLEGKAQAIRLSRPPRSRRKTCTSIRSRRWIACRTCVAVVAPISMQREGHGSCSGVRAPHPCLNGRPPRLAKPTVQDRIRR